MPVGPKWTYKLRLEEQGGSATNSHIILGRGIFAREQEARTAGEAQLKAEIEKRSS